MILSNFLTSWYGIVIISVLLLVILFIVSSIFYKSFFKRFYDILLSFLAIIVLSPILVIFSILGLIIMKGNPFFIQKRPGKDNKIFNLIKFRTMTCEKDKEGNLLPDEKRLTKYGTFLRKTSIDELPELFCIFIGTMSIVGPRPQLVRDLVFMDDNQKRRHEVRPGLTGLAQINGRNNITWEQKFIYDLDYIDSGITLFTDLKIIFQTVFKVLKRSDIVREGTSSDIDFGDWLLKEEKISNQEYVSKLEEAKELMEA